MTANVSAARIEWEADSLASPREVTRRNRTMVQHFRRRKHVLAWLDWTASGCTLLKLESAAHGQGAGSDFLEYVKRLADKHELSLHGNPVAYSPPSSLKALSQQQLEAWYQRHGFSVTSNGRGLVELRYPSSPR